MFFFSAAFVDGEMACLFGGVLLCFQLDFDQSLDADLISSEPKKQPFGLVVLREGLLTKIISINPFKWVDLAP